MTSGLGPREDTRSARVANTLRTAITKDEPGTFRPGSRLPSEADLQEGFSVSRGTARAAIEILRQEGLVVTRPGRGTFVRDVTDPPKPKLRVDTYDYGFNVPLTIGQIQDLANGKTLLLEFGPDTEMPLGGTDPQNLNIAVILRPVRS